MIIMYGIFISQSERKRRVKKLEKLLKMRKIKGLSQIELAEKIGVKSNTISQYESGKRNPNFKILKKLAKVLNCTVDELI